MSPRRPENPPLDRERLAADPMEQFAAWSAEARGRCRRSSEAMTLATVDERGRPDARMVLLKGFGPDGFRFFTNYESAKGSRAGGEPPCGAGDLLARARPAGSGPGRGRAPLRPRTRTSTSPAGPETAASRRSSHPRAGRSSARSSTGSSRRCCAAWATRIRSGPSSGAAIWSDPMRSSSGRAARTGCTTASSTPGRAAMKRVEHRAARALIGDCSLTRMRQLRDLRRLSRNRLSTGLVASSTLARTPSLPVLCVPPAAADPPAPTRTTGSPSSASASSGVVEQLEPALRPLGHRDGHGPVELDHRRGLRLGEQPV